MLGSRAIVLALTMAAIYIIVVRFLDMNEKEPLWAIAMLFGLGAAAAAVISVTVPSGILELTVLPAALAVELAHLLAIGAGVAVLAMLGQARGWSEINGLMDGVVYGAAGGFGYATAGVLIREIMIGSVAIPGLEPSLTANIGRVALAGMSDGVFGAIIGVGFAAALHAASSVGRAGFPIAAFAVAVGSHVAYLVLSRGAALAGTTGLVRAWTALALPSLLVVAVATYALFQERRAIREHLGDEAQSGAVSESELATLGSFVKRQVLYLATLAKGRVSELIVLRELHNRQVQLGMAKQRAAHDSVAERRAATLVEVEKLRAAVLELKTSAGST